jgi:hypothetical protein
MMEAVMLALFPTRLSCACSIALLLAGGAARAQEIIRSGPDASHAPIVNGGPLGFIRIDRGAAIDAGPDGNAIRNLATGQIGGTEAGAPDGPAITVESSTLGGAIENQGTIGARGYPALSITGSTVAGGIVNHGEIRALDSRGIEVDDSRVSGGLFNDGGIAGAGMAGPIGGPAISIQGGSFSGGIVNAGSLNGVDSIDAEAESFSGGIVNSGHIGPVLGKSPFALTGILAGGTTFAGGLLNSGQVEGGIVVASHSFQGDLVNSGAVGLAGGRIPAAAGVELSAGAFDGSLVNRRGGTISGATGLLVKSPVGGDIYNLGTIRGATNEQLTRGLSVAPSAIVVGPGGAVMGSIVNAGVIEAGFDTDTGQVITSVTLPGATGPTRLVAVDLGGASAPTVIANKGGLISGDVVLSQGRRLADTLLAEGGSIFGNVRGDGADTMLATPGPGGMVIAGSVTGFANIAANQGRTLVRGGIDSPGFVGIGLVSGTPATLELGAGQVSRIGMLAVYGGGTLATDVTASGEAGRVVAKSAYVRGTLELDLQPGSYGATTVYDDVVTAPNLGATPRTTFKRVTTNAPGFTASVSYDNGTADVTLTRTGTAAVAAATPRLASAAAQTAAASQASDPPGKVGRSLAGAAAPKGAQERGARRSGAGARGGDRASGRADHGGGRHGRG